MSSEEKEAYFDGPLVTTPTAQGLFYPGGNPQPFVPMGQPAPPPQPPMIYNSVNNMNANAWEAPLQPHFQPQYNIVSQSNPTLPGAQAHFGGVESGESVSSSVQTSPERNHFQKTTGVRLFNLTNFEQHAEVPAASSLFTHIEDSANSSNSQSTAYNNSQFPPEPAPVQSALPPSGGASGQQGFVPLQSSAVFAPPLDMTGAGVQAYMNPVLHTNSQQHQNEQAPFFVPGANPDLAQAAPITDNEPPEDDNASMDPSFDLHNGTTNHGAPGSDQRYLNMAYNHNSSGNVLGQDREMNSYAGGGFQPGVPMIVPVTTSGQDYDILHSQGTWKSHHPAIHGDSANQVRYATNMGLESNQSQEDAVHGLVGNDSNLINHDFGASFQVQEIPDEVPQLEASGQPIPSNAQTSNAMAAVDSAEFNRLDIASGESNPASGQDYLKQGHATDLATLTLDYKGSYENCEPADVTKADAFVDVDKRPQPYQQSYEEVDLVDGVAANKDGLMQKQNLTSTELQNEGYAVRGPLIPSDPAVLNESPIPSDGLHHEQPVADEPLSSPSHQFASPNSAFESRIRSQSIGSNNSNSSSQKSASGFSGRSAQNRSFSHLGACGGELSNNTKSETAPSSCPFNTTSMHSSHNPDFVSSSTPSEPLTRATVPDIVRPFPSNSNDENLRTGATMVPYTSSQSLHSQVLRNINAYPPEPRILVLNTSATVASKGSSQPDLVRSPEGPGAIPKSSAATDIVNAVAGLKISATESEPLPTPTSAPISSGSHDPYLSHTLHNSSSNLSAANVAGSDHIPSQNADVPMASTPNQSNVKTDDLHEPSRDTSQIYNEDRIRRNSFDKERRYDDDSTRKSSRDSRWSDDRYRREEQRSGDRYRRDDEYTRRDDDRLTTDDKGRRRDDDYRRRDDDYRGRDDDYRSKDDERYRRRYDHSDERDKDDRYSTRQRHEQHSRPSSWQSGYTHEDPYQSRRYDDPYYDRSYRESYYRDPYWSDRFRDYSRRDYYHPRNRNYYDYGQYPEYYPSYTGYGREPYDYPHSHSDSRHLDEDDSRSTYTTNYQPTEHEHNMTEREWSARHDYSHYDDPRYGYPPGGHYYDENTVDGSTISHTFSESLQHLPSVRFGAGGQLIKVLPNRPTDNQPTTVEIHSVEVLLQNTSEAEDLRSYPGPLSKEETHKNDVLQFTSSQAAECLKASNLMDRHSTALIWDFLSKLVRQNGSVLGTDIAELLTKDHSGDFGLLQSPLEAMRQRQAQHERATPVSDDQIMSPSPAMEQAETKSVVSNMSVDVSTVLEKNCFRFRDLLLHGRKKDALEWAMKSSLWGHALLLASKTDSRTHAQVMLRFANSLPINDPLQTVYQLMSGRQPAAATCVSEEGWGDWRPHLAMILSNPTPNPSLDMRAVLTMGDTLSARGLLHAAHFCYLMTSTPLGYYGRTSSKMVLLGGNHILAFGEFAKWESIRRTEIYEYAISLGKQHKSSSASMSLPSFQPYKFLYAFKLAEYGLIAQAFHYCEQIAKCICKSPPHYSLTLVNQLVNLSDQLRYHDPQIQAGVTQAGNLKWLETLRNIALRMQAGSIVPRANAASSLMTTSNTPSVVSSSPSSSDQIQFGPHGSDLEEDGNVAYRSNKTSVSQYRENEDYNRPPQTNTHVVDAMNPTMHNPSQMMQQAPTQSQSYSQEAAEFPAYSTSDMHGYGNHQVQNYPNVDVPLSQHSQHQQQSTTGHFSHLADQANPLAAAYPSAGAPAMGSVPYQSQTSYGFQPHPSNNTREEAQQHDQVDYYNYIESRKTYQQPDTARARTISQSSQRSRSSTVKGMERTTPTATYPYIDSMQGKRSRTTSENSAGKRSRQTSGDHRPETYQKGKEEKEEQGMKKVGSWRDWFPFPRRKSKQIHLPDDSVKDIVYDEVKQRWVNKNATEEESAPPPPPPTDRSLAPVPAPIAQTADHSSGNTGPTAGAPQMTPNRFSRKNLAGKLMYKDAFGSTTKPFTTPAPMDMPGMFSPNKPTMTGFMVPNPVPTSQPLQPMENEALPQHNTINRPDAPQSIPMFTPGNTPQGSASDFTQPFNHEYLARNSSSSSISSSAREVQNLTNVADEEPSNVPNMAPSGQINAAPQDTAAAAGPTMFFNRSQLAAQPDLLAQPSLPSAGRGNPMSRRGRGRPMYPTRT